MPEAVACRYSEERPKANATARAGWQEVRFDVRIKPAKVPLQFSTHASAPTMPEPIKIIEDQPPDQVAEARYVQKSKMFVRFADGLAGTWSFSTLGLDMSNMKVETIRAPKNGTGISVKSIQNEDLLLDSSMVRYKIDPKYAAMIDHAIAELHLPLEEAREAARLSEVTRDPRWNEVGDEDDLFE